MALIVTLMHSASAPGFEVAFAQEGEEDEGHSTEEVEEAPNPILPVAKEIAWGLGSFLVLFALMRYLLFPKVKGGMEARSAKIAGDHADAEQVRAAAEAEVAEYRQQLATIRAEGQTRIDAARAQLDGERQERLAEVNARLGEVRAQSAADVEAAKRAAMSNVVDAVAEVSGPAAASMLGRPVDPAVVRRSVDEVVRAGVAG